MLISPNLDPADLTMKEAHRYKVISEVNEGYLKVKPARQRLAGGEAAFTLGLSQRQIYRIKVRVQEEGSMGVIHKSKGKKSPRHLTEKTKDKIDYPRRAVQLYKTKYRGFNLTHMTEFLNSVERIKISRESVRQILLGKGSYTRKKRYPPRRVSVSTGNGESLAKGGVRWFNLIPLIMIGWKGGVLSFI